MSPEATFDSLAQNYDRDFSHSLIGSLQRSRVRTFLKKYVETASPLRILEINCGTGEDALWLASLGHDVLATDASDEMLRVARQKPAQASIKKNLQYEKIPFADLQSQLQGRTFDLIFSNFSGLNCIPENELRQLDADFAKLLTTDGKLVMVLFGKYCWMERLYFFLRSDKANQRRRDQPALAKISDGVNQPTWYYSSNEMAGIFSHFRLSYKRGVGLFIPPSYLERKMKKVYLPFIRLLESVFSGFSSLADHADHVFIVLNRK